MLLPSPSPIWMSPPSPSLPSNAPPSGPISSPSPLWHRLLPPFRYRPFASHLLSLPQHPSSTPRHVLSQRPPGSSAPALSRRPSSSPALALSGSPASAQCPPSFRHCSAKQDRIEGLGSVLFGRTKGLRSVMFGRTEGHGRTKALRSVIFGQTVPKGRKALGASAGKIMRGAGREHVPRSGGRVLGKREETGGREAVLGRGKGVVSERRCIAGRGVWREKRMVV